jgi:hypothetical protein
MAKDFIARQTLNGLGTFSLFTVPSDGASGLYFVNGQMTIPTQVGGAGVSSVLATIKVNAVGAFTGVAGATGFQTTLTLQPSDAVTVVLSSSGTADQLLNAVRGVVSIGVAI